MEHKLEQLQGVVLARKPEEVLARELEEVLARELEQWTARTMEDRSVQLDKIHGVDHVFQSVVVEQYYKKKMREFIARARRVDTV